MKPKPVEFRKKTITLSVEIVRLLGLVAANERSEFIEDLLWKDPAIQKAARQLNVERPERPKRGVKPSNGKRK
jgi:hypothetical protein